MCDFVSVSVFGNTCMHEQCIIVIFLCVCMCVSVFVCMYVCIRLHMCVYKRVHAYKKCVFVCVRVRSLQVCSYQCLFVYCMFACLCLRNIPRNKCFIIYITEKV